MWYYWEYKNSKSPSREHFDSDKTAIETVLARHSDVLCIYRGKTPDEKEFEAVYESH